MQVLVTCYVTLFVEFVFVVVLVCPRCGTIMALDLYD